MSEKEIMKGNIKLVVFDTFPMEEMIKVNKALNNINYFGEIVSNGNIVYQKKRPSQAMLETFTELRNLPDNVENKK